MKSTALLVKFLLELAALAALSYWGATIGPTPVSVVLAVALPLVAAVAWGIWAAPRSARRLEPGRRVGFEMAVFVLAAIALVLAGLPIAGALFLLVAVMDEWLLHRWGL
jgi:hypothetical protein